MKKIITYLVILFLANISYSQVYWAQKVERVSSQYSPDYGGANGLLGVPNVDWQGRPSPFAWKVEPNDLDKEGVEWAYADLSFGATRKTKQIAIFESYLPGAVSMVFVNPFKNDSTHWELVYVDTSVIARTIVPPLPGIPDTLYQLAGSRPRRFVPPDNRFKPKKYSNILRIFLSDTMMVNQVRIVINPLAIDGWNQIDAVGISPSSKPIEYPKPDIVNQSLIIEPGSKLITQLSAPKKFEVEPVVYPDGNLIFFSRNEFSKQYGIYTQNIWISQITKQYMHPRQKEIKHQTYTKTIWWYPKEIPWKFNTVLPNAVVNFSADGQYMYLTNTYKEFDKDNFAGFFSDTLAGLSVSHLDTVDFTPIDTTTLAQIQKFDSTKFDGYYINKALNLVVANKLDTIDSIVNLYLIARAGEEKWSRPYLLGNVSRQKFLFTFRNLQGTSDLWLYADSLDLRTVSIKELVWSKPQRVKIDNFENKSNYTSYYVSRKYGVMFLALDDSSTTLGQRDLYISFLDTATNTWSTPQNLGIPVNTIGDESSPFLDDDGRTLYFASNGHKGFGGYDIFVTYRNGDGWFDWTTPQNLGQRVNTPADETNFKISQTDRYAYYVSTKNIETRRIQSDIYKIKMAKPITLHFKGTVKNCTNNRPYSGKVKIIFKSLGGKNILGDRQIEFYTDMRGQYDVKITRFIDANRLGKFALIVQAPDAPQADTICNAIAYLTVDLSQSNEMVYNIFDQLYVKKEMPVTVMDFTEDSLGYEITQVRDTTQKEPEPPKPEGNKSSVVGEDFYPQENQKCSYLYYNKELYIVSLVSEEDSTYSLIHIPAALEKIYEYNDKNFDTKNTSFNYLMTLIDKSLQKFDTVTVLIVASASDVPTTKYSSNLELARLRAEDAKKHILENLDKKYSPAQLKFETRFMVEGEVYQGDPDKKEKYKPYQYVRIWAFHCNK